MWTRFVFVLLLLLAPAASLATPACCADELPAQGCAPEGDCPTDVDGDCAVPELVNPPATAPASTSAWVMPVNVTGPILRAPGATPGAPLHLVAAAVPAPPAPIYLRFQSLRN